MSKKFLNFLILITILLVGIFYGISIQRFHVFPYRYVRIAYNHFFPTQKNAYLAHRWSIGIYEGSTPFNLVDPESVLNPVITKKDVVDVDAIFVADPFMTYKDGKYTMFFEVMNRHTNQGDIGCAESFDGIYWNYRKIVIDEKFHLSYPHIFEWNNNHYLIPESSQDLSVRLYKAISFPDKWKYIGNILSGYPYVDPSIFQFNGKWWLFVSTTENNFLNLYYSKDLFKGWKPHPMNPIVKFNKNFARPGGRVIKYNGKLYRFAQNYVKVFAFEIKELSDKSYAEQIVSEKAIVNIASERWNAAGMHHIDMHQIGNKWIAVVDGRE